MLNNTVPKIVPFTSNVQKYGTAGQATCYRIIWRMPSARWITKTTDTHSEYVTHCFSATMVTHAHLSLLLRSRHTATDTREKKNAN